MIHKLWLHDQDITNDAGVTHKGHPRTLIAWEYRKAKLSHGGVIWYAAVTWRGGPKKEDCFNRKFAHEQAELRLRERGESVWCDDRENMTIDEVHALIVRDLEDKTRPRTLRMQACAWFLWKLRLSETTANSPYGRRTND